MQKSLEDYKKEGWKIEKTTITGYEEGYDEENNKVTFIVYSDGSKCVKCKGWERYGYKESTYHVPYDPSNSHTANKGKPIPGEIIKY